MRQSRPIYSLKVCARQTQRSGDPAITAQPNRTHFGEVAQAELVAQPPQHDQQHEIGRVLEVIVRRTRALIEDSAAPAAAEGAIAKRGAAGLLRWFGRGTAGAGRGQLLHATANAAALPESGSPNQPLSDF